MNKLWNCMRMFLGMTLLTGLIYPLLITAIAQLTMRQQADGSLLRSNEKINGSLLIAQKFESDKYFWGRPSGVDYNPLPSGGSNLGPTSAALKKAVDKRKARILTSETDSREIPSELLFASGSGVDPHISLKTAYFQIDRIAKSRGIESNDIKNLIDSLATEPSLGFLGTPCVNVLVLNRALDARERGGGD